MSLYSVSNAIDILVEHFSSLDMTKVENKRAQSFTMGWREPDFLSTNVHELQTKRQIENLERYSKATMELDAIESEEKLHIKMEGDYRKVMQDPTLPDKCKKGF